MKTVVDFAAASELTLYAENTRQVYDLTVQVIANLKKKFKKGVYNAERAVKAFEHVAEYAAKEYAREFSDSSEWFTIFNAATRRETAKELLCYYTEEITES